MAKAVRTSFKRNLADPGYIEQNKNYFENFLTKISELQTNEFTCDVTIKIKDQQIHAHKIVLAGGSSYFSMCFFGELASVQRTNINGIKLDDLEFNAVNSIIEYFYTTRIKIDEENVKEIYRAADFLQVDWIRMKCFAYIKKIIGTNNCIDFWDFAELMCADQLVKDIVLFILQNLSQIFLQPEFLLLSNERVRKIILHESSRINAKSVYMAILKWTKEDKKNRRSVFMELVENIPIKMLGKDFITTYLTKDDLFMSNRKTCYDALLHLSTAVKDELISDNTETDLTETASSTPYIFVLATENDTSFIQYYNPYDVCLKYIPPQDKIFPFAAVTAYKDFICISGGLANVHLQRNFIMYNTVLKQWSTSNFLNWGKAYHDMVVHNDVLYACDVDFFLEKFDFGTGTWSRDETKYISKMYRHLSADVLDSRIFAASGFVPVKSALRSYDPREGKWQGEANHAGICSILNFKDSLYISSTNLPYLEKYDVRNKTFIPDSSPLPELPKFGHTLVGFDDSIYLFDVNGKNAMAFNPSENQWIVPKPLKGYFNYVRAAVPNV